MNWEGAHMDRMTFNSSRKRKGEKTTSSMDTENLDAPQAKHSKIEENNPSDIQGEETRLKKVWWDEKQWHASVSPPLIPGTEWTSLEIQRCAEERSTKRRSQRIARTQWTEDCHGWKQCQFLYFSVSSLEWHHTDSSSHSWSIPWPTVWHLVLSNIVLNVVVFSSSGNEFLLWTASSHE